MDIEGYEIEIWRQDDGSWVAEIPAVSGCYALMATREQAPEELKDVFRMICEENREKGIPNPPVT
jgi:predicted RNase H-like HicB family nuclease